MKRILEDIKSGSFRQVYVLYGQEAYLQKQYRDKLIEAMIGDGDTMNFWHVQGKDFSVPQLIDFAETMPFLAERRVIVMEGTGILKSGGEELAGYFQEPCETTNWIIVNSECPLFINLIPILSNNRLCPKKQKRASQPKN